MTQLILQPSGNKGGREHYVDTVENQVEIQSLESNLPTDVLKMLLSAHPGGKAGFWGVVPGKNEINVNKWARINVGDIALFAREGKIVASGVVSTVFRSKVLAKKLWGDDISGNTWECMYSLDEIRVLDIPYSDMNKLVGYDKKYVVQGFNVLDSTKCEDFIDFYDLRSVNHIPVLNDSEFDELININLDGELDKKVEGWRRAEQGYIRKKLINNLSHANCFICGNKLEVEFLIAAHIKKRSECSPTEKRDISGNLMLACKFGCDDLFEKGYISVDSEQKVLVSSKLTDNKALSHANLFKERKINVKPAQNKYFRWHAENIFMRAE